MIIQQPSFKNPIDVFLLHLRPSNLDNETFAHILTNSSEIQNLNTLTNKIIEPALEAYDQR